MTDGPKKILIIKLGYSETLDAEIGKVPSLGDVLRTTPILWAVRKRFPDSHISWLVSSHADQLLKGNPYVDRLLVWDEFVPFQLMKEKFDILINLEKVAGVCAIADMIDAWTKYGFRFDGISGHYHGYERGLNFISYIEEKKKTNRTREYWQQVLVEMLGVEWKGQEYIIGYTPKGAERYDVGFNHEVGAKFPFKALPAGYWKTLEERLSEMGYTVSWQRGLKDLHEYMDWIHSCRMIVSCDSLGYHLAMGMKKKVVGLFGPTDANESYRYGDVATVESAQVCPYMPCYGSKCASGLVCMKSIDLARVVSLVGAALPRPDAAVGA